MVYQIERLTVVDVRFVEKTQKGLKMVITMVNEETGSEFKNGE